MRQKQAERMKERKAEKEAERREALALAKADGKPKPVVPRVFDFAMHEGRVYSTRRLTREEVYAKRPWLRRHDIEPRAPEGL